MPDSQPDPVGADPLALAEATARARKLRGRNIALFLALLAWVLVIYVAFMVKIHTEMYGQ